jgi:hypothetical protein
MPAPQIQIAEQLKKLKIKTKKKVIMKAHKWLSEWEGESGQIR